MATSNIESKNMVSVWSDVSSHTVAANGYEVFTTTCPETYNGLRRIAITIETDCDIVLSSYRIIGNRVRVTLYNVYLAEQTVYASVHAVYSNCPHTVV